MPAKNLSHRTTEYKVRAKLVRERAYANPSTRCWRCGLTLLEEQARRPGKTITWHAGHTVDADNSAPLLPEHSSCNSSAGATAMHLARTGGGNRWW